ncbi:hypothetical protein JOY44_18235 [Phormidium sp. CLA17]|uniref:hypothetical protein n=1 Tax=Leptolyngbya sp. Cla-17 TaxID=2803751 RepID=UPI0017BDFC24|nr:hypothetical protein [Leptolyngbya sp. Cla-17]MBM0743527.1 hypothetical protein [Leptolyngbya sp. Cla-17]
MPAYNSPEGYVVGQVATIINRKLFKNCHITLPDLSSPISAIQYQGNFYSYFRYFPTLETAQRVAGRLGNNGNVVVLTQIPKGLVLWIFESEAQLAKSSPIR